MSDTENKVMVMILYDGGASAPPSSFDDYKKIEAIENLMRNSIVPYNEYE